MSEDFRITNLSNRARKILYDEVAIKAMVSRRMVLGAVTVGLAGCLSSGTDGFDPEDHVPDEWHENPKRGLAEPIEKTKSFNSGSHETTCEDEAIRIISEFVHSRVDDSTNINPVSCCEEINEEESIIVYRRIEVSRDGDVVSSPNIGFKEVREATPARIKLTLESDTGEQTCIFPVYVKDTVEHIA